ncbi:LapA family protein [Nocardioides montaniterrae]
MNDHDETADNEQVATSDTGRDQSGRPAKGESRLTLALTVLAILLILLIVFVGQNTEDTSVQFLGWTWHLPLALALLVSVAIGLVLAVCIGTVRALQRHRKARLARKG